MKIHYLQHVAFEGPGYIETWLCHEGHEITSTHFYKDNYILPEPAEINALIVMGGSMSVYDEHEYPWLHHEKAFIEDCIQQGVRVLGICLGAQLLAVCLGSQVYTVANKEIGWYAVTPTSECRRLPWMQELFEDSPVVFHWHGERFEVPYDGSMELLFSAANGCQAFAKENIIGLQFHLEVTERTIADMLQHCNHELVPAAYIQSQEEIKDGKTNIANCNKIMAGILKHWLA